jgi:HD-GYP domain-containing protein (c-di-GMP phosphodiesterase class II)
MSKRANFWTLIGAQTICTALGLWIQQRYLAEELGRLVSSGQTVQFAADPLAAISEFGPTLMGIGLVTFIWTNGLLGMIVYMVVSRVHDEFARRGGQPAVEALRRTTDLLRTQDAVIFGLAKLADSRDSDTGEHLDRIALYSSALASALRRRGTYREVVTPAFVEYLGTSAALHDIGKVGIEDSILRKPGPLTADERRRIQEHARIGERCLREIECRLGSSNFLRMAREIVASHHERWDGTGYPAGLKGDDIPLAARIVAVADVYDALATKRVYKEALPHDECVEIIRGEAGKQFDPLLVETFLEIEGVFRRIAHRPREPVQAVPDAILDGINQNLAAPSVAPNILENIESEVATCCGNSSTESARS